MNSKINLYSIKDSGAGIYMSPFTSVNDSTAMRNYKKTALSVEFTEDLDLYKIGTFNTDTAEVVKLDSPELVCSGSALIGGE